MNEKTIDEALAHYVEAALFSANDESDERGGVPLDSNYTADDIDPDTLAAMRDDVAQFLRENWDDIQTWPGNGPEGTTATQQAGHDLWFTRNGHGVGFWEPEWPKPAGDRLDAAAKQLGECWLYVGDDGRIHLV